jgi:hypothetical protein
MFLVLRNPPSALRLNFNIEAQSQPKVLNVVTAKRASYFLPSTMMMWYPNPVFTSAYLGLVVVLGSSSYAAFSKAALRLPRTFQPRDPPVDDQFTSASQVKMPETTFRSERGKGYGKARIHQDIKRTSC